jgi:hypothetical protein
MHRHPRWFRRLVSRCAWLAARLACFRPASRRTHRPGGVSAERGSDRGAGGQGEAGQGGKDERLWSEIVRGKAGGEYGGRARGRVLPEEQAKERQGRDGGRGR